MDIMEDRGDGSRKYLDESGIEVGVQGGHTIPEKSKPFFNPKMKTCRELVLAVVGVLGEERKETLTCLDAFGASGVAGLQWKKRYGDRCHVTITEKEAVCVTSIMDNCLHNGLLPSPFVLEFTRVPGLPLPPQRHNEVFVKQCDVNVMMHMEAFDFIHLDPFGCPVKFLVSAFTNIRNNGVICLVATDVGSLFAKNTNVARRNYGTFVVKTEYVQELGARVLIASAVRAAAGCCKGVEVLCTVNREHFVLACLRVRRGAAAADRSVQQVREAIHCQICGERALHPATNNPLDHPYSLLPCRCHGDNPGKTAVTIGPMWCGDLFDTAFVLSMYKLAVRQGLSKRVTALLAALVLESACPNSTAEQSTLTSAVDHILCRNVRENRGPDQESAGTEFEGAGADTYACKSQQNEWIGESQTQTVKQTLQSEHYTSDSHTDINFSAENNKPKSSKASIKLNSDGDKVKGCDNEDGPCPAKCLRLAEKAQDQTDSGSSQKIPWPSFYYDLHRQKLPGDNLPKTATVVSLLQRAGFRASKTHFNSTAVRTSANLSQICSILSQDSLIT